MNAERWIIKLAEFSFLPVLAYFATRTCPYCYSIGFWRVFLPLFCLWIAFIPAFYLCESKCKSSWKSFCYIVTWGCIGWGLGLINIELYAFSLDSVSGSVRVSVIGGSLLLLFKNNFLLRRRFEQAVAGQVVSRSEFGKSKSLVRSSIHSVITVYTMFTALLFFALISYLDVSLNVPQLMRQRAVASFIWDIAIIFAFHTAFALAIAFDVKTTLSMGTQTCIEALSGFVHGEFSRKAPVFGSNEMGTLADAVNQVGSELSEKERIRAIFGKYMNPMVAAKILKCSEGHLEGETKKVALLFMDIEGFTAMSEKTTPAQTVEWLNRHFDCVVRIIHGHNGIIDKFIGDAVLAYFDGESCTHPAESALDAADELIKNKENLLPFGIGLHAGVVVAGNIGSHERLEYTIIGDAVNTVTRIEGLTRTLKAQLLVSDELVQELNGERSESQLRLIDRVTVKGRIEPIQLWTLADGTKS
jgi:class 3 adenylate cyclase